MMAYRAATAGRACVRSPRVWVRPCAVGLSTLVDAGTSRLPPGLPPRHGCGDAALSACRLYSTSSGGTGAGSSVQPHATAPSPSSAGESAASTAGDAPGGNSAAPRSFLQRLNHMLSKEYITAPLDFNRYARGEQWERSPRAHMSALFAVRWCRRRAQRALPCPEPTPMTQYAPVCVRHVP